MRILIFAHPLFLKSESMPRFARMLQDGLNSTGHDAKLIRPAPYFWRLLKTTSAAKWASYLDQYVIFPFQIIAHDIKAPKDTLFVFADQALGPWVPYVRKHAKVVHCLDLLALKSALGLVPENPTGLTGRVYQRYIRWGFQRCSNFISISGRTAADLQMFGGVRPEISKVIYLGLNYKYKRITQPTIHNLLARAGIDASCDNYLLHVGGSQWYKNRRGLLTIYSKYAEAVANPLPLICVSPNPGDELRAIISQMPQKARVLFLQNIDGETLEALYSGARLMIFPSLAEGFGWPIVEAQACGCPVITTDDSPMNEIAGPVARLLPLVSAFPDLEQWAQHGAHIVADTLNVSEQVRTQERASAMQWAENFRSEKAIDDYLNVYREVLMRTASTA